MSSPSLSSSGSVSPHFRVVLADDHPIVRASVRCLLETSAAIKVVAEAADGEEALSKIERFKPDVALVDVSMPKLDGIEVIRRVASFNHRTRVLALSALEDGHHVRRSLAAGAAGYIPKSAAAEELIAAIHVVADGGHYVHPRVVGSVLETMPERGKRDPSALSVREDEVLRLIALGYTNKEISSRLSVSVKTVETYKARGMEKIDAASRVDIVRYAAARGWLGSLPPPAAGGTLPKRA